MPKLTKRFVDTLTPRTDGKDLFVWDTGDGAIKGFGIRMKRGGSASYLVQYRNTEGRTRRIVLGKITVLTPDEARNMAADKLRHVAKGGDPSADRRAARETMTVSELCDLFLEEATGHMKLATVHDERIRIDCHIRPLLGSRAAKGLTVADIERFQADVANGKTAKGKRTNGRGGHARGGRGAAARTVGTLSSILSFAMRRGIITDNPVRFAKKLKSGKRTRFLSKEEIAALGAAMRDTPLENRTAIAAIKALLLTGCRRNEILALPADWLDTSMQCIRFKDTKTGAQLRPIGATAMQLLAQRRNRNDGPYGWLFPAETGEGHFIGLRRVYNRLCETAGITDANIHTLRHTFAAHAASLGYSELTIAGLLGHKLGSVTARYAHVPDTALLSAADRVAAHIAALLDGSVTACNTKRYTMKHGLENPVNSAAA